MHITSGGRPLFRGGKPVLNPECCCGNDVCFKGCFYVHGAYSGFANEPGATPPLTVPFSSTSARVVYHGHNQDDGTSGALYHAHLWIMEFCITPTFNASITSIVNSYLAALASWTQNELPLSWIGTTDTPAGDTHGILTSCSDEAIATKKAELLTAPVANTTTDILALLPRDGCPDCDNIQ